MGLAPLTSSPHTTDEKLLPQLGGSSALLSAAASSASVASRSTVPPFDNPMPAERKEEAMCLEGTGDAGFDCMPVEDKCRVLEEEWRSVQAIHDSVAQLKCDLELGKLPGEPQVSSCPHKVDL